MSDKPATRFAKEQLRAVIERIERLEEEKKATCDDIREVYAEAKGNGFDVKAIRTIVKLRKQDVDERKEQEAILETYMHALGMLFDPDIDLGRRPPAPERNDFADTKVTISTPGMAPIETTAGAIQQAADHLSTPRGKRDLKRAVGAASCEIPPMLKRGDPDCYVQEHPPPNVQPP